MKFGKLMSEKKVLTWAFYYLDYNSIKKLIVRKATSTVEGQQREANFAEILERELQKINSFHSLKASELIHALKSIKKQIETRSESKIQPTTHNWFNDVIESLDNVTDELIRFDDYKFINLGAFTKLLKKHDKHQENQLRGFWQIRLQKETFVCTHDAIVDKILLKLSKCYFQANQAHERDLNEDNGKTGAKKAEAVTQQNFERTTTKYWVPADKVLLVKAEVLKHLPISSFNKKSSGLITSVYYDNPELDVYHERLKRLEGSIIIRMRTYNEGPHSTVFVERKVHHDSWVAEKSVKSRFPIKEKNLLKYLRGELSMEDKLNKMKAKKLISDKDYDQTLTLANEIQTAVVKRKLEPKMTSRYERTAFQLEGDATVRVSLDSRFDLIHEFGYKDNRWGRDLSNDALILDSEIHHFPHAILEIKLSLGLGENAPLWVQNLLAKDYIISCGKFSKFIHGCAVLIPKKVTLLPSWFPQLEATSDFRVDDRIIYRNGPDRTPSMRFPSIAARKSDVKIDIIDTQPIPVEKPGSHNGSVEPSPAMRKGSNARDIELVEMGNHKSKNSDKQTRFEAISSKVNPFSKKNKEPKKKKIQAPIKVEPKTFFANERTFLQWMSFLIFVEGIGFTLMTVSTVEALRIGGLIFICISMLFMVYAIFIFLVRRLKISRRERGPYDERFGPVAIVVLLIIGICVTVALYYGGYINTCKGELLLADNVYHYNPSEVIWDYSSSNRLITVGPDVVTYINAKNFKTTNHPIGGDWEGVAQVPGRPGYLYLGLEYPPAIHVVNTATFTTERTISLDALIPNAQQDAGLEAVAWVPRDGAASGGDFWVGNQNDGKIYIVTVDLDDPSSTPTLVQDFTNPIQPIQGVTHLQGLSYNQDDGYVYGVTGRKFIFQMDVNSKATVGSWGTGVGNPEGVCVHPSNYIYVACDLCGEIWKFKFSHTDGIKSGHCTGSSYINAASTNNQTSPATSN